MLVSADLDSTLFLSHFTCGTSTVGAACRQGAKYLDLNCFFISSIVFNYLNFQVSLCKVGQKAQIINLSLILTNLTSYHSLKERGLTILQKIQIKNQFIF